MFLKNHQMFFLMFIMSGSIIAISANSWFICWVGLEINLMSLIPLILSELNFKSTEAAIKYFLAQALASVILVASSCIEILFETYMYMNNFSIVIFLALAIKAGLAPFHLWFPPVMNCVTWFKCFIILTWQKIAPFVLISCFFNKKMTYILIFTAATVGALGGLNQINTKLILTYSSIAHSAWMLMLSYVSLMSWAAYFFMYVVIVAPIIMAFFKLSVEKISEMSKTKILPANKNLMIFLILSLGGLPPFLGFSAKMMAFLMSMKIFSFMILILLVSSSLISLFYYTKLFFNVSMNSKTEININFISEKSLNKKIFITSIAGNLIMSLMVLLT